MKLRTKLVLPALLGLLLAACGGQDAASDTAAPATTETPAPAAPAEQVADEPALEGTTPPAAEAAADAEAVVAEDVPATPVATPVAAPTPVPGLTPGQDYEILRSGQPLEARDGKIEVVEVFAYSCGHCAAFEPLVQSWKKKLPGDVRFVALPAVFYDQDMFPAAYFAAEAMGVLDGLHPQFFKAMHVDRSLRPNASADDIASFVGKHGVDGAGLKSTMGSFAVRAKIGRAKQFIVQNGVDATPTIIVNGRYRVRGRSLDDVIRITDILIAHERAAAQ